MEKGEEFVEEGGWKEGEGFGEVLEYVGRYGFTNIKGGKFSKSGK